MRDPPHRKVCTYYARKFKSKRRVNGSVRMSGNFPRLLPLLQAIVNSGVGYIPSHHAADRTERRRGASASALGLGLGPDRTKPHQTQNNRTVRLLPESRAGKTQRSELWERPEQLHRGREESCLCFWDTERKRKEQIWCWEFWGFSREYSLIVGKIR